MPGVLTIGTLGAGRAEYYLARQAGCTSEYYTGSGERRGLRLGGGAAALGLSGDIDEEALRHLLAVRSPDGSTALTEPVLRADPCGRLPDGVRIPAHVERTAPREAAGLYGGRRRASTPGTRRPGDQLLVKRPPDGVPATNTAGRQPRKELTTAIFSARCRSARLSTRSESFF